MMDKVYVTNEIRELASEAARDAWCKQDLIDRKVQRLSEEVAAELNRAISLFGPMRSPHEALGVIEEEWEEFRKEVWAFNIAKGRDTRPAMRTELIQLAAMALRAVHDVIDNGDPNPYGV